MARRTVVEVLEVEVAVVVGMVSGVVMGTEQAVVAAGVEMVAETVEVMVEGRGGVVGVDKGGKGLGGVGAKAEMGDLGKVGGEGLGKGVDVVVVERVLVVKGEVMVVGAMAERGPAMAVGMEMEEVKVGWLWEVNLVERGAALGAVGREGVSGGQEETEMVDVVI